MPCEICGSEGPGVRAKIEGSILRVCRNCAKFGEILPETKVLNVPINAQRKNAQGRGAERRLEYRAKPIETENVLALDYGKVVRRERERLGLSQKDLAQKLNERESIVRQIEQEHIKPDGKTIQKIERLLGVKLLTVVEDVEVEKSKASEITLSDIAKIRKA